MSYPASAALAYETYAPAYAYDEPYLELVEGTRTLERSRAQVQSWTGIIQAVVIAVVTLILVGIARVGIYTATVNVLQESSQLRSEIRDAQALSGSLEVEGTRLASIDRIGSIATDTYGMVLAKDVEVIYVAGSSNPMSISSVVAATAARARELGIEPNQGSAATAFARTAQVTYGTDHAVAAG